jgi:transposase-like protein
VSEAIEGMTVRQAGKRQRRTAEEKQRIVEATLVPGASIARVAREHGVFQWRYEYRKRTSSAPTAARTELLPVTLASERGREGAAENRSLFTSIRIDPHRTPWPRHLPRS